MLNILMHTWHFVDYLYYFLIICESNQKYIAFPFSIKGACLFRSGKTLQSIRQFCGLEVAYLLRVSEVLGSIPGGCQAYIALVIGAMSYIYFYFAPVHSFEDLYQVFHHLSVLCNQIQSPLQCLRTFWPDPEVGNLPSPLC